jgi:hypothetical protein
MKPVPGGALPGGKEGTIGKAGKASLKAGMASRKAGMASRKAGMASGMREEFPGETEGSP